MVITILEALVEAGKESILKSSYDSAVNNLEAGIKETFLVRNIREVNKWQIVTVWESKEALDAMRKESATPRGILIFRDAGAEPVLSVFEVVGNGSSES